MIAAPGLPDDASFARQPGGKLFGRDGGTPASDRAPVLVQDLAAAAKA
ncbi:hypothetical protein [Phreatobacter sp.]